MKNNKILLILCFIILLLSLNSISANIQNDTTSTNDIQKVNEITQVKQAQTIYVDTNTDSNIEDGSKNNPYKNINNENLEKITSNTTIHVAKGTYKINPANITKDITIIGENQKEVIFTSDNSTSIFSIQKGSNVHFKNFTIKDFTSNTNAAITNYGNLALEDMQLYNNIGTTGANMGGSILNNGNLTIINTTFEKNTASFGAAIYNNANATIRNSSFVDNNIYNVGGAIYSNRGNLTVDDSYFTLNRAVSGAAIYSAFGNLKVNNTVFYDNDAERFFGGAIYSTGIAITSNSLFDSNHATKDGGAITTTSNFTIINCTFTENFANENGGAIENVPWTEDENGNLTIINSTFIENAATLGGAIVNYGKIESVGEPATVTARNCIFDSNTADRGGTIYNEQYVDMQYNVFTGNEAKEGNVIYTVNDSLVRSLDNNWWTTNNPTMEDIGFMPQKWVVMNFTNTTSLYINKTSILKVSLNTLNDGTSIKTTLPARKVTFSAKMSTFDKDNMVIMGSVENTVQAMEDDIAAEIDNQIISLRPTKAPTPTIITVNPIKQSYYKDTITINGKFMDTNKKALINTLLKITINNKTVTTKTNNKGIYSYEYKTTKIGSNNINVSYHGNSKYEANKTSTQFKVNKKNVKITLNNIKTSYYKDKITISGKFTDINEHILQNSNIQLNINNKKIIIKTNNKGIFTYKFTATKTGLNKLTATYKGNSNYNKNTTTTTFNIAKKPVHIVLNNIKIVNYKDKVVISGKFEDKNNHTLLNTRINLNIDGKKVTVVTNKKGTFNYTYKTNKTGTVRVTASFNGNNNYSKTSITKKFTVKKQDLNITINKINKVKIGQSIKITGKLTDKNNHPLLNSIIKIKINNKNLTSKTNNQGIFTVNYKTIKSGLNNITVSHEGNSNYNKYSTGTHFRVST